MDSQLPTQVNSLPPLQPQPNPPAPPQQPSSQNSLKAIGIGLLEAGFVALLLTVLFVFLNYFNLLRFSAVFPALSFLPHKTVAKIDFAPQTNIPFTYSVTKTDGELGKYLRSTLQDSFLPVASGSADGYFYTNKKNVFTTTYILPKSKAYYDGSLTLIENTDIPNYYLISVQTTFNNLSIDTATQGAQFAVSNVFTGDFSKTSWQCKTLDKNGTTLCSYIVKSSSGEKRYKIILQYEKQEKQFIVNYVSICFISQQSSIFGKQVTCKSQPE